MTILVFIFGVIIGSFLNVCIYRLPREESIVYPPSHCPNCSSSLRWYDLVPILSYILQRGKCRYCKCSISIQYPLIELLNGIAYIVVYNYYGFSIEFLLYSIIISILIVVSFIDFYHQIIPDILVVLILFLSVLYKVILFLGYEASFNILNNIFGLLFGGILFLLIALVSKGGMGGGDIKLISVLGFILGLKKVLLNIFLSFIIGAVCSVLLMIFRKKGKKDAIPFGPFINIAFILTLFFGDIIISWYFNTLY